ncbi:unnamed protein product [Prunus armeniaca]|uniref:Bidirectional sugar transporter SWEET n=1 Tax=Prunus armeniaca TaxID=36596 RepID=A0A6J5XA68_PRUAR|nr:unnamed protein product [Prunus armeniaca]
MAIQHPLTLAFGLLGIANIISFLVFLAPVPTFYTVYKRKTAEGFQALPYVLAPLEFNAVHILCSPQRRVQRRCRFSHHINSFGCVVETLYISLFLFYAPKKARISTLRLVFYERFRLRLDDAFDSLSSHRCCHVVLLWSSDQDYNIAFSNILGFLFGIAQMVLYIVYKNTKKVLEEQPKVQELSEHIIDVVKISSLVCPELSPVVLQPNLDITNDMIETVQNIIVMAEKTEEAKEAMDIDASNKV